MRQLVMARLQRPSVVEGVMGGLLALLLLSELVSTARRTSVHGIDHRVPGTMASMRMKCDTLCAQLGLDASMPVVDVVEQACEQLGLDSKLKGKTLAQKVNACMDQLGVSAGSLSQPSPIHNPVKADGEPERWAGGKQHVAKTGPVEGRWEVYRNIDMCFQGDVEVISDWKHHTSIDKLKKIVEEKGYSAVCVGSFGHAALKSFDYQLTKEHCKPSEGYTNELHIWFPSAKAAKPPKVAKVEVPDCTLVMAHAAECVKLLPKVAQALRAGRTTPLLLASPPGYAIVPKSDEPQRIDDWGLNYQHLGIGPASEALQAKMHGEFLLSQHPATRDYVLDVPFATYAVHCEGEHGKLPLAVICWDDRSRNLDANAPRTFVVNADNSISPTKATHLAFGIRGVLPAVAEQGTPVEAGPSGSVPPLGEMVARALGVKWEGSLIKQAQKRWAVLCGSGSGGTKA